MKIKIPKNIDRKCSAQYVLTFRIYPKRISFTVYDPHNPEIYFYYPVEEKKQISALSAFQDIFFENDFFALPFKKINLINYTSTFTHVPSLIFKEEDKETYLNFLFSEYNGKILSHPIPDQEITVLHVIPENVYAFFHHSFIGVQIVHYTSPVISSFQGRNQLGDGNRMIVLLQETGIDIFCFSRERFLLANYFHCEQIEDRIYYILFTWKKLKFDRLHDFIYISGENEFRQPLIETLNEYLRQVLSIDIELTAPEGGQIFDNKYIL